MLRIYVNSQVKSKRKFEIVICTENISRFQLFWKVVTDDDDLVIMNMNGVNVNVTSKAMQSKVKVIKAKPYPTLSLLQKERINFKKYYDNSWIEQDCAVVILFV